MEFILDKDEDGRIYGRVAARPLVDSLVEVVRSLVNRLPGIRVGSPCVFERRVDFVGNDETALCTHNVTVESVLVGGVDARLQSRCGNDMVVDVTIQKDRCTELLLVFLSRGPCLGPYEWNRNPGWRVPSGLMLEWSSAYH